MVGHDRLLNREMSWLEFNARVLALAERDDVPLLERAKFCAIFSSNLDEFFQVRVAGLKGQVAAGMNRPAPDGLTPSQQLDLVSQRVAELVSRQESLVLDVLLPHLDLAGIEVRKWEQLDIDERKQLVDVFENQVFPVLTPLAVDPAHPFPYISNLSMNLAVFVSDPETGGRRFARLKLPPSLPRFLALVDGRTFVPVEEVIAAQVGSLFPGMEVLERSVFRVTRNADLTLEEEEADDLLAAVEMELRRRRRSSAVRLEVTEGTSPEIVATLQRELELSPVDVSFHRSFLDLRGLFILHAQDRPDLKDEPWPAVVPFRLAEAVENDLSVFDVIRQRSLLVHHPYESFAGSVEEFIRQAAADPAVLTIKMTLYRTSGESPIARSLIAAAERGVQVAVLVELKARFDEAANITWARRLEQSGVHVVYGLVGLKTHAKCVLVVRQEADGLRRYAHLGTGNYNSSTARLYEDFGLLTDDPELGADLTQLFNHLTGYSREVAYRKLVDAPQRMRDRLIELVENEAAHGADGRVVAKMNSLADPALIDALYFASSAGVRVDLIVRGICCLRPGVPGLSENITVRSIVGRNLEHSRIYDFANGEGPASSSVYIGSADWMPRNLDRRVEILIPIDRPDHVRRVREVLDLDLHPDARAWHLGPDGTWTPSGTLDTQEVQHRAAVARSRRTAEPD